MGGQKDSGRAGLASGPEATIRKGLRMQRTEKKKGRARMGGSIIIED